MNSVAPLTVTELTARIKQALEQGFAHLEVKGEVSRLTSPSSGHLYFTIKDNHASISAAVWRSAAARLKTRPKEGQEFIFKGHISLYEPRGTYQLIVTQIEAVGAGQLAVEFERRKTLFAERGWFAPENKQLLPKLPQHIGIVTSATAAAFEDVKKVLSTRPAWLQLSLSPCLVQGAQAPHAIANAIQRLHHIHPQPDMILLVRGGGSMEDLWCFNDEIVIKAIVDSQIPIISGIGHEIDTTLADFAADVRAATPSNAAELCCPSRQSLRHTIPQPQRLLYSLQRLTTQHRHVLRNQHQSLQHRMQRLMDQTLQHNEQTQRRLATSYQSALHQKRQQSQLQLERLLPLEPKRHLRAQQQQLHMLQSSLLKHASQHLQHSKQCLHQLSNRTQTSSHALIQIKRQSSTPIIQRLFRDRFQLTRISQARSQTQQQRLKQAFSMLIQSQRHAVHALKTSLQALDPNHVLQRGYSMNFDTHGQLITHAQQLHSGDTLIAQFQDGTVHSHVDAVQIPIQSEEIS